MGGGEAAAVGLRQTTLQEAVRDLVKRGCTEPVAIMAALSEEYGQVWLLRQITNVIAVIAAGDGRDTYRRNEVAVVPGVPRVQRAAEGEDVFSGSVWVWRRGWVALRDLTADDCRAVASQYARLAVAAERHRDWFLAAAEVVDREKAVSLGQVRDLLPPPLAKLALEQAVSA